MHVNDFFTDLLFNVRYLYILIVFITFSLTKFLIAFISLF